MAKKKNIKKTKKKPTLKAKGSLVAANKEQKARTFKFDSKAQATLKSLFELPTQREWLDDDTIDKINRDSTVTAAIGRRKSATLKKEILINCDNKEIKNNLESVFDYDTLDSMLDIPFQGFGVFELLWKKEGEFWYPKFIERDYQSFVLEDRTLKYSAYGVPQDIPIHKALYGTFKAKPKKPYGQPLYNPLYWLINFKNASMEFWIELLERFGTPWVIAKTEDDKDLLADEIYHMLGGDGAVIGRDDEIDIKTAEKVGNFKEIIEYIDDQTRELITGGNLTGNVKGGSHAAADVHNNIREDIAKADENILNKLFKQTVYLFKEGNRLNIPIEAKLKDKDDPNKDLADRDKLISDMGWDFEQEYIQDTYNVKVKPKTKEKNLIQNHKLSFNKDMPEDELENQTEQIDTSMLFTFQKQILETIKTATSAEDLQDKLLEEYPEIDTDDLHSSLRDYFANSNILAIAEIEEENPNG